MIVREPVTVDYTAACPQCGRDAIWTGTLAYTISSTGERHQHTEVDVFSCLTHGFHPIGVSGV
jgi:hypothetical protein